MRKTFEPKERIISVSNSKNLKNSTQVLKMSSNLRKKDLILNVEKRQQTLGSLASAISDDDVNLLDLLKTCLNKAEKKHWNCF